MEKTDSSKEKRTLKDLFWWGKHLSKYRIQISFYEKKKIMLFNWILSLYSKLNCSKEEKSAFNSKIGKLAEKMDLQLVLWSECLNEKLETYTLSSQKQNG